MNSQAARQVDLSIPVLSFFTGAGFLDLGFLENGFRSVWHNEFNKDFAKSFEFAMGSLGHSGALATVQCTKSISDTIPRQIAAEAFGATGRPDLFGVIGGPPCPDFSVGGKNRGHTGENGILTQVYAERILTLVPTFFVLENVPGLLRTEKHRLFFNGIRQRLEKKYLTTVNIVNALELGVPQDRERVFVVGFLRSWLRSHEFDDASAAVQGGSWFSWPSDDRFSNAKKRFSWPSTSPFGSTPARPDGVPSALTVSSVLPSEEELDALANGREGFNPLSSKFTEIAEGDTSRKSFKRLHRWRYSPTAAYGNNEVHLHPCQPRRITVREALRIQSVPDRYALPEELSLSFKFKMIGNGVPVVLAAAIGRSVRDFIGVVTT